MSMAMHLRAAACLWACASAASADGPSRIVSADLCADAYVFALADREAIAAVSWQAGQPVSGAPGWALELPRASHDAERLMALAPELVVFGPAGAGDAGYFLDRAGIPHIELGWGEDWQIVDANLRALGEAVERPDRAAALREDIGQRRAALAARAETRGWAPSVFYLSVTGGAAGANTLVDTAIRAAGGSNAAAEAGAEGWLPAEAEWAFRIDPDVVLTSYFIDGYQTRSDIGRRHSAYRRLLQGRPRIDIPASAWSCAGPDLIDAAEAIAEALDNLEPGS
ncbi:ABC transporter substrate-binding protein [Hyphobacterium sp. HN65]|uniref:ABC transporter substrate-binding protein n=1 Tax=Hyphobacterium lacteum TaxID=3116575 RepID=A0ABU7LQB5_9PROT|nr:ABC transporter substrate-binding protein [Hyphobacterium sp. HN65]MEE2525826.1 ABC transporter substrate-binding protein [Hyphobacterium sp. HN65]